MKHLVFGATGQIGAELKHHLATAGKTVALSRPEVDFQRPETAVAALREYSPQVIWNAAAQTAVDALEGNVKLAFRVNAETPAVLADEARRLGSLLVHFSTDYVFDGTKPAPYSEDDSPGPLNTYGASKLAGEQEIQSSNCRFLILRTSWIYGATGVNFLRTIATKGLTQERLPVVEDQIGAPTWSRVIGEACGRLALRLTQGEVQPGIYHLTAAGQTSWYGFAEAIRDSLIRRGFPWRAHLTPVASRDLRGHAARPANSVLSNEKAARLLGLRLPPWNESLERVLDESAHLLQGPGA